jgi:formate dehydrogenase accessory protein FdhE
MTVSPWQRRIQRAQELARQYSFAAEILGFYIHVARFQEDLHTQLSVALARSSQAGAIPTELSRDELENLSSRFEAFLSVAEAHGPKPLAELSRQLRARGRNFWLELLNDSWSAHSPSEAQGLLALAFLQPYAELLRSRTELRAASTARALCPFCNRKPSVGVLRQMGDGGARSMICSFCLAEWEFRRIVCPGCGEENDKKLPVFTATDFDYIRVECCETCKTYIKSVNLTKNGRAEPVVDELASAPLDLWAREHGYAKLQTNLLGI